MKAICFESVSYLRYLVFIQLFSLNAFSQKDTLYFDIYENEISKVVFNTKLHSKFYNGIRYSSDTLVVQGLIPNHVFGQLSPVVKSQLFKMLSSRSEIDTLKTLSLYYKDTLITRNEFPKKDLLIFRDSLGKVMGTSKLIGWYFDGRPYKKAKYHDRIYSFKGFNRLTLSIFKKYRKFKHVEPVFFYGTNNGLDLNTLKVKWHKDYGYLIKNLFRYKDYWFGQLIIKPNGEYYVRYGYVEGDYRKLFNIKEWDKQKAEFLKWNQ